MLEAAIVGNPNSGKSTVFNALTGARQHIGNWPGVTVEKKVGALALEDSSLEVVDLPGTYSIQGEAQGEDEKLVQDYLAQTPPDCLINVLDARSLSRGLYLTTQLLELGIPVVVVLNKLDSAETQEVEIDIDRLAQELGCPVIPAIAKKRNGLNKLRSVLNEVASRNVTVEPVKDQGPVKVYDPEERYNKIDEYVENAVKQECVECRTTKIIDTVVLNKFLAIPIFLLVMYLMFMFTMNFGSAFIEFFDIVGNALFVNGPRQIYMMLGFPDFLTAFLADGVGGGIQLVGTFIPVIASLFLFLSFLEDSGYMGRVAFMLDRLMQQLGLPGKSFVPLVVGFGCNVPAVMATRSLENKPDRILTTLMAPFMSCSARLTVYTLFAAAFFPYNGQNIVFLLYLIGILVAVGSAWIVRKHLLPTSGSMFSLELPSYHLPTVRGILTSTWHRLSSFIKHAGRAIVLVVIVLNVVNSIGIDGSFGNTNSEKSALSVIGKKVTPIFHPMGIDEDNWPATVGIFTGIFAKEVLVGTLDALYSPASQHDSEFDFGGEIVSAIQTVPVNLSQLGGAVLDPLGISIGDVSETEAVASERGVEINTVSVMADLFHGQLGAFSYLLFILLYMPCVAMIGAIYKELGVFWATFSTLWSLISAYSLAVLCYQLGTIDVAPLSSVLWATLVLTLSAMCFYGLIYWGRSQADVQQAMIPVKALD